jgi:hypothetical protein
LSCRWQRHRTFSVVRGADERHPAPISSLIINPNEVAALLLAAVLGNALLVSLWGYPTAAAPSLRRRAITGLLLILTALASFAAWRELYWNRSDDMMLAVLLFLPVQFVFAAVLFFRHVRRCGAPPGWGRVLLGNALVLLCLVTFTLAVGEVYFRFVFDTTDSIAYTKASKRWLKRYYHRNKARLRDNVEYELAIAPGSRRVSFLGDSFTAGHGIKDVEDRFSNRIRRQHPEWEIHVLAGNGMDTGGELGFLEGYTARGYQLDQVVLVYCLNDINDLLSDWMANMDEIANRVARRPLLCDDSYLLDTLYYRLVIARLPWIRSYFSYVREAYQGQKWEEQKQRLRTLRERVESQGGKLSVMTFPFFNALGPNYEYQFVHDKLNAFWREENVPHLDLLPVFQGMKPAEVTVNAFDAHPNERANALAADLLNPFLQDQLRTNAAPVASRP